MSAGKGHSGRGHCRHGDVIVSHANDAADTKHADATSANKATVLRRINVSVGALTG